MGIGILKTSEILMAWAMKIDSVAVVSRLWQLLQQLRQWTNSLTRSECCGFLFTELL